jgi:hypothetical protein
MIITLADDSNTMLATKLLSDIKDSKEHVVLVDLSATGQFQKISTPEGIIRKLETEGNLHPDVKTIDLYISDTNLGEYNLAGLAEEMAAILKEKGYSEINIRTVTDYHYDITVLTVTDAEAKGNWQVFGIKKSDLPAGFTYDLASLLAVNKTLLWEGDNLDKWLANPSRTFKPTAIMFGM